MAGEKDSDSEDFLEETASKDNGSWSRYAVPAAVVLLFVVAVLGTNALDSSISGAAIATLETECNDQVSELEAQNAQLKEAMSAETQTLLVQKNNLELENVRLKSLADKLEESRTLYGGMLDKLATEGPETVSTPFGFKVKWEKYIIAKPGEETMWSAEIENVGPSVRSLTLDLQKKSVYMNSFTKEPAVVGSLTLQPYNSGILNVKLAPEKEGYAIFGIYVNNNYVGDLVVFAY